MTTTLPKWLAVWLGAGDTGSGEGTLWSLRYQWPLPAWVTLIAALAIAVWVAYCYRTEIGNSGRPMRSLLTVLRWATLALLAFMLTQMLLSLERTGLPPVVVLIDDSASMAIEDRLDDSQLRQQVDTLLRSVALERPTRLNLAKGLLLADDARLLRTIDERYKLRVFYVSELARATAGSVEQMIDELRRLEPLGTHSYLGQGIRSVLNDLRGTPPAAIVLFTDGINTDGESLGEAASVARRRGVPLFTVALGSADPVRDLEVSDLLVDEVVFLDDLVNFEARVSATGFSGQTVDVVLREQGAAQVLARRDVTFNTDGQTQTVQLPYRPTRVGEVEYVVEIEPREEEIDGDNNRQSRVVSVRKEQIRVLYVQSYPNYEFRYLKHMLERDPTIVLRTVLQEADADYLSIDATALGVFPVRRDELFEYDVVLFGDVDPAFLSSSAMQNLHEFVIQKGGGVVFLAGPRYTPHAFRDGPLGTLLPLDSGGSRGPADRPATGFQVRPTDVGLAMPAFQLGSTPEETARIWNGLPPLYWLHEAPSLKPAARVLAERQGGDGQTLPVIVMQYVGAGKVIFHATDESWRWRWRIGDLYFARYWVQTLRYLARAKLLGKDRAVELSVDRREYRRGEPVRFRARFLDDRAAPSEDDGVIVIVEQEGKPNRRVTLQRLPTARGVFEGVLSQPTDGRYHAWITAPAAVVGAAPVDYRVVPPPGETERLQTEFDELRRIATQTKGQTYDVSGAVRLLDDLPRGRPVPIELLPPIALWNQWPLLASFLTLLVAEWILRKRVGML